MESQGQREAPCYEPRDREVLLRALVALGAGDDPEDRDGQHDGAEEEAPAQADEADDHARLGFLNELNVSRNGVCHKSDNNDQVKGGSLLFKEICEGVIARVFARLVDLF